ncbi:toll/interleukin-1 receptor (TIR) domain-containing protein [Artemisia annua]|uniref:Toll/interleukin-1 receptor (TIR) domain-containing protein n=1 Tax=Artemisia annua TaxID=35608 RepID=A0A2U1LJH8_ARTAN|nr:toll/interleukin-1 receptor (TIR) domain-containing protein [Artemisia annua]
MGKNIVRCLHLDDPNKHNRLWIDEEIEDILANNLGTKATNCTKLTTVDQKWGIIMKGLQKMKKNLDIFTCLLRRKYPIRVECLKLVSLDLNSTKLRSVDLSLTPNIEKFNLEDCNELVEIHMPAASLKLTHVNIKGCPKLRFLYISGSRLSTLDVGLIPDLERLDLKECYSLVELLVPSGCLKKLVYL